MTDITIDIDDILNKVAEDAKKRRDNAGLRGEHHDGGYSYTMDCIRFYMNGQAGIMPKEWAEVKRQMIAEHDAEYNEYLRLSEKFKDMK